MKAGDGLKRFRGLRIFGLILAALGLTGLAAGFFASSAMIVAIGVRAVETLKTVSVIVMALGGTAVVGGIVPNITDAVKNNRSRRELDDNRARDRQRFSDYAKDSLNPDKTRARLEQLRRGNPNLSSLIDICIGQMNRMDTFQARHRSLLEANDAIYLEDTIDVINDSETRMCRNFRNIINCCILIEGTDRGAEELDRDIINSSLGDNEEELKAVDTLIRYSVAYINNYNRNGVTDRSELDAWLKVMRNSTGGKHESF